MTAENDHDQIKEQLISLESAAAADANEDDKQKHDSISSAMTNLNINNPTASIVDVADLEYDEEFASLVAEQVIDDLSIESEDSKIGNGQLTSDSLIEEDFEVELGAHANFQENLMESEADIKNKVIRERIDRYGIVNVCGSDRTGRPIILLSACKLPDSYEVAAEKDFFHSHQHFFQVLLEVVSATLDQYVESEYTLVYLHYGLKSTSQPSFNWLAKFYKMLDRNELEDQQFKKNLKALFIVHPTTLIKVLWHFLRPLISSKFNKKVTYCNTLADLANFIDLDILKIPDEVRIYDAELKLKLNFQSSTSMNNLSNVNQYGPFQQFKVSLEHIANNNNGDCIPLCLKETVVFLRQNLDEEGLFRKSGSFERIRQIQTLYNLGQPVAYDQSEIHVAACVLKVFFRELPESLLPESIFNEMMSLQALDVADKVEVSKDLLAAKLPKLNYTLLKFLIEFLSQVASHSSKNKMDAKNLSCVFGPNFLRPKPGADYGLIDVERINSFVELLIKYHSDIFSS